MLAACGSAASTLEGTWANERGSEVLIFESDGTCSVSFTYDGAWLESCDRYIIQDDGTLVLSCSKGNIRSKSFEHTDNRDEALDSTAYYYLNGDELVIDETVYLRS